MPNLGVAEIFVILVVALVVFGPEKLPELGRQVGRAFHELRRIQASLQEEVREVLEPVIPGSQEPAPTLPPLAPPAPGEAQGGEPQAGAGHRDELGPSEAT